MAAVKVDNLQAMFAPLVLVCFGCGAVIVPCQVIASVVCPDDLIATVFALTISVRIVGSALGYAIYYSILTHKFAQAAVKYIATAAIEAGIQDPEKIKEVVMLVASSARQELMKYVDTPDRSMRWCWQDGKHSGKLPIRVLSVYRVWVCGDYCRLHLARRIKLDGCAYCGGVCLNLMILRSFNQSIIIKLFALALENK
jgi:hypothetical protein